MWERAQRLLHGDGHMHGRHDVAFRTRRGATHRVNQDAGGAWSAQRPDGSCASLLLVADGVSAGPTSEEASALVVARVRDRVVPLLDAEESELELLHDTLLDCILSADRDIAAASSGSQDNRNATTVVAVVVVGTQGAGVWCGDSRAYLVDGTALTRLTADHSWSSDMVRRGMMSEEEAAKSPRARMITGWLGPPRDGHRSPESLNFTLAPGNTVFCCSDGLYGYYMPPEYVEGEMARIVNAADTADDAVNHLVAHAVKRGGHDDITVALLRLEE